MSDTTSPRIGSLFSGIGGLDLGVVAALGGTVAWHVEREPAPGLVLEQRFPGVTNFGDINDVQWADVEPVDILTGGFPCQDVSYAGLRRGLRPDTRSGLWSQFAYAISHLDPELVIIENVSGLLTAHTLSDTQPDVWNMGERGDRPTINAFGAVLRDLAQMGYDARWGSVLASEAGAPHKRERVFIVAYRDRDTLRRYARTSLECQAWTDESDKPRTDREPQTHRVGRTPQTVPHSTRAGLGESIGEPRPRRDTGTRVTARPTQHYPRHHSTQWGDYEPAIARWEAVLGRPVPVPYKPDGKNGQDRISVEFVEWMMGFDEDYVAALDLSYNAKHRALGNAVVPQQAALAIRQLVQQ